MNGFFGLLLVLLLSLNSGCKMAEVKQEGVSHVVICWLKDDSQGSKADFIKAVKGLRSIPAVIDLSVGSLEKSIEPVADNSFDLAFVITFRNKADLDSYLTHQDHVKAVKTVLKPSLKKVIVYDFKHN